MSISLHNRDCSWHRACGQLLTEPHGYRTAPLQAPLGAPAPAGEGTSSSAAAKPSSEIGEIAPAPPADAPAVEVAAGTGAWARRRRRRRSGAKVLPWRERQAREAEMLLGMAEADRRTHHV